MFGYIRWMGLPLKVKGQVIGMLTLDHGQSGYHTLRSEALARQQPALLNPGFPL